MKIGIDKINTLFPIDGEKVRLDLFSEINITDEYLSWLNDPITMRFSNQRFIQHNYSSCLNYLNSFFGTNNIFLAIYLKEPYTYIGTMSIYISTEHDTADIGIMVGNRSCLRRGVGSDAWRTILNFLSNIVKIRKITGGAMHSNIAMINIMINSKMQADGTRIGHELLDGKPEDICFFSKFN